MTQTGVDAVIYLLIALGAKMRQNAAYVLQKEAVTMPIRQTVGVAFSSSHRRQQALPLMDMMTKKVTTLLEF